MIEKELVKKDIERLECSIPMLEKRIKELRKELNEQIRQLRDENILFWQAGGEEMSGVQEKLLRMLFYDTGGRFYEIIDKDGIRKPAITTYLSDAHIEDGGFNEEIWTVKINWRLLDRCFGGDDE